jgi:phage/plasmid-like protein (TIGR03299 family)
MAHKIDTSTGKPAIAYVGETPWHGLGEKLPEDEPIEAWLDAARLQWELKRLPVQYLVDGKLHTMNDRFVLARSDTHAALSVVSAEYQIVQPREVLEFYRQLMAVYGYTLETAGALDDGRKVWALARTPFSVNLDRCKEDSLGAYILLATSCDKTLATTAAFTSVRVVCQNTLSFAIKDMKHGSRMQVKVPHSLHFDPERVKQQLGLVDQAWVRFIDEVGKMADYHMEPDEALHFFEGVLQENGKPLSNKAQRECEIIVALSTSAPGQDFATAKSTLWGTLNAVTYFVDHVRSGSAGDRLNSAWFGSGHALKERAWQKASALLS